MAEDDMSSVKDLRNRFQDQQVPMPGSRPPPIAAKRVVDKPAPLGAKPALGAKPSNLANGKWGSAKMGAGVVPSLEDLKKQSLKKSPPPRIPRMPESTNASDLRSQLKPSKPSTKPPPQTPKPISVTENQNSYKSSDKENATGIKRNLRTGSIKDRIALIQQQNEAVTNDGNNVRLSGQHLGITNKLIKKTESVHKSPAKRIMLPPAFALGKPPVKPPKPRNVRLPPPTAHSANKPPKPGQVNGTEEDFGDVYDDVATEVVLPPIIKKRRSRQVSMIEPMGSDEEDPQEIYDDSEVNPSTETEGTPSPALPSLRTIPKGYQTSGGSMSSAHQTSCGSISSFQENSGSGQDCDDLYDPVDAEEEDELYEPLEMEEGTGDAGEARDSSAAMDKEKEKETHRKKDEKQKKELEKQQKKEEERRKREEKEKQKKELEEKKKKEKTEKEMKKKFKIKGDLQVLEEGYCKQDINEEFEKFPFSCKMNDKVDILRRDSPNPSGKLLVQNDEGQYGYVDISLIAVEEEDDVYDTASIPGDDDCQDIYDVAS